MPHTVDCLQGVLTVIPMQLLSFHIAVLRGYDVCDADPPPPTPPPPIHPRHIPDPSFVVCFSCAVRVCVCTCAFSYFCVCVCSISRSFLNTSAFLSVSVFRQSLCSVRLCVLYRMCCCRPIYSRHPFHLFHPTCLFSSTDSSLMNFTYASITVFLISHWRSSIQLIYSGMNIIISNCYVLY